MKANYKIIGVVFCMCLCIISLSVNGAESSSLDNCNIVWDNPSKGMDGSMPFGKVYSGMNVWMEENGDLLFYIREHQRYSSRINSPPHCWFQVGQ